ENLRERLRRIHFKDVQIRTEPLPEDTSQFPAPKYCTIPRPNTPARPAKNLPDVSFRWTHGFSKKYFDFAGSSRTALETRRRPGPDYPGVVEDQDISGIEKIRKFAEGRVRGLPRLPVQYHHPRCVAGLDRLGRDEF